MENLTKKELMCILGNNVRKYRMERRFTQEELAERVGVNASAITRIEGGSRMMSVLVLHKIATTLRVSIDSLFQEESGKSRFANIQTILFGQSSENLVHLERIIQAIVEEYGDIIIANGEKENDPAKG